MPDRADYFRCPVCRSLTCEEIVVRAPDGTVLLRFYTCAICTLVFRDPLALTRGYEDRPKTARTTSGVDSRYQSWAKINQGRKDRE
jgi:hypothetical protein